MRYYLLKKSRLPKARQKFVSKNLLRLKAALRTAVPPKTINDNLLLSTWNLRDFDSNKYKHGPRLKETYFYIAETISAFDLVAVQEINNDLRPLRRVMNILGDNWEFIVTDCTEGASGNGERMAFVYDKTRVSFENVAGEIVLPKNRRIRGDVQFARTPFMVAFQSGWLKFKLCTVHIYFGSDYGERLKRRVSEIEGIAKFLSKRADKQKDNFILLGDFNIVSPRHKTMKALEDNDFVVPDAIKNNPSNMFGNKHYDQIAFKERKNEIQLGEDPRSAGVFDIYDYLFREEDFDKYEEYFHARMLGDSPTRTSNMKYYLKKWRTFQLSDHLPMWVELKVNFSRDYLSEIAGFPAGAAILEPVSD